MKWNWVVLFGAIVVILSAAVFPVVSYSRYSSGGSIQQVTLSEPSGVFLAVLILLFMYSKWKGRVLGWTVLGLTGAVWVPMFSAAFYDAGKPFISAMLTSGHGTPFAMGLYLIVTGFVVVVAGAAWEYMNSRRQNAASAQS